MISTEGAWIRTCAKQLPSRREIGEIKSQVQVYDTLQTSDSSWEFLKIEKVKTVQTILIDETGMKLLNFE